MTIPADLTDEQLRSLAQSQTQASNTRSMATELLALRARVAQLEEALCRISTACRKDTKDPLLDFVVLVVDAALTQPAELEESKWPMSVILRRS